MTDDDQIIEAETVDPTPASDMPIDDNAQRLANILKLEDTIKRYVASIDNATIEMKKQAEMLEDIFLNDSTYQLHLNQAKEANKVKNKTKGELMKRTEIAQLAEKVKEVKSQVKDMKDALSDYLIQYKELSGANEIEGEDGQVRQIISTVKLVKKSAKRA